MTSRWDDSAASADAVYGNGCESSRLFAEAGQTVETAAGCLIASPTGRAQPSGAIAIEIPELLPSEPCSSGAGSVRSGVACR